MKGNKLIKILIIILVTILLYITLSLVIHKPDAKASFVSIPIQISNSKDWSEQVNKLESKLKQDASINVLQGTIEIEKTYTNKDFEGTGNKLSFIKKKLTEWQSRELTIHSIYKFGYAFDVSDLRVRDLGEGNIEINLYQRDLQLKYIEELEDSREIKDEYGILANKFTPTETSALISRTKIHVKNSLNNNVEIRNKAMEYSKSTIEQIATTFDFKDVKINVIGDNLVDNDEVEIKDMDESK